MMPLIKPLLQEALSLAQKETYFKYFLPKSLQEPIENFLNQPPDQNGLQPLITTLIWDKPSLKRLLKARFRSAGSRRVSFNNLAPTLKESLDDWLLNHAHGSPRRLLQLINALIDEHTYARSVEDIRWDIPITQKEMANALNHLGELGQ